MPYPGGLRADFNSADGLCGRAGGVCEAGDAAEKMQAAIDRLIEQESMMSEPWCWWRSGGGLRLRMMKLAALALCLAPATGVERLSSLVWTCEPQ